MTTSGRIAAAVAVLTALAAGPTAAQVSCSSYAALAESALPPAVGSPAFVATMVSGIAAWTGNGLSRRFVLGRAQRAVGERFKPAGLCATSASRKESPGRFTCEYANSKKTAFLDVVMPKGRVVYLNPGRRFDPSGPENAVSAAAALTVGRSVLEALGVPPAEIDGAGAHAAARMLAARPIDQSLPPHVRRMEMLATFTRKVNGFPVLDSGAKVAIDVEGKPARAHVAWPDFAPAPGLAAAAARSRADVVAAIVEAVGALDRGCEGFVALRAQAGWIPAQVGDRSDEEDAQAPAGRYVPGLRVMLLPPETAEDSGAIGDFVHVFTVPLAGSVAEG